MVLKAFFDDSKTDDEVLVLGGYVASAEHWARFADEWQEVLSIRPPWRRFKASEVCSSSDEIVRERVRHHYKVIRDHVLADVGLAIPIAPFRKACREYGIESPDANPYFLAWNALIVVLLSNARQLGITEGIELYFDTQSEKTKILLAWDNLERQMPRRWRNVIRGMPSFKDDQDVMPLQAADFCAWWFRKAYLAKQRLGATSPSIIPWETDPNAYGHLYADTNLDGIRRTLRKFRDSSQFSISASISKPSYGANFDWSRYGVPFLGDP